MSRSPAIAVPPREALPSARSLRHASLFAFGVVLLLAIGVVLPAETGRDPTGLGERLGLREMGRIKVALAREAQKGEALVGGRVVADDRDAPAARAPAPTAVPGRWRDSSIVTLQPNQGIELKLTMQEGDTAYYQWTSDAGEVYYHRHGEPPDAPTDVAAHSYDKGMASADSGAMVAAFRGIHGWFFRNRAATPVRITLRTRGTYTVLRTM
jgi:hypothetical protein